MNDFHFISSIPIVKLRGAHNTAFSCQSLRLLKFIGIILWMHANENHTSEYSNYDKLLSSSQSFAILFIYVFLFLCFFLFFFCWAIPLFYMNAPHIHLCCIHFSNARIRVYNRQSIINITFEHKTVEKLKAIIFFEDFVQLNGKYK